MPLWRHLNWIFWLLSNNQTKIVWKKNHLKSLNQCAYYGFWRCTYFTYNHGIVSPCPHYIRFQSSSHSENSFCTCILAVYGFHLPKLAKKINKKSKKMAKKCHQLQYVRMSPKYAPMKANIRQEERVYRLTKTISFFRIHTLKTNRLCPQFIDMWKYFFSAIFYFKIEEHIE